MIQPAQFLPAAENYGLIEEIDLLAVKEAAKQIEKRKAEEEKKAEGKKAPARKAPAAKPATGKPPAS